MFRNGSVSESLRQLWPVELAEDIVCRSKTRILKIEASPNQDRERGLVALTDGVLELPQEHTPVCAGRLQEQEVHPDQRHRTNWQVEDGNSGAWPSGPFGGFRQSRQVQ